MAITKSAKKANRASKRKRIFNLRRKKDLHDKFKEIMKASLSGNVNGAGLLLPAAYKAIDKAAKRGILKKNTAARKKSRITLAIARINARIKAN